MADKKRIFWFIFVRVVVVSFFLVSTILFKIKEPELLSQIAFAGLTRLIIATYAFSIASLLVLNFSDTLTKELAYAQIVWDLVLVSLLLIFTGGINSPYSFLYFLSIINASVFLARREAYYTASLCGILYGGIIDLQFFGSLTSLGLAPYPAQQYGLRYIFYTIFLNIAAYYLTAFLAGHLSERARISENALQEKVVDYEELEKLNSSIVETINIGLLTINNAGRIRAFNRFAEIVTGIDQQDAYDQPLVDLIPGFAQFAEDLPTAVKGEFDFFDRHGGKKTLAFKSVPLTDKTDVASGVIIDFQDVTQLKQMQAKLKRADQLAAVGELSARIAHEIRNPLASISGAVELIAQNQAACPQDKQLLKIVMRETDRLNNLIGDFLEYARPTPPVKVSIQVRQLIDELSFLLKADQRFVGITVRNQIPEDIAIQFDLHQCKQVFWNLLLNAGEALGDGGMITIRAEVINDATSGIALGDLIKIVVADDGPGMSPEDVKKVFEPFFTTKPNGTGLGLATVYRIVEGHGGIIIVDSKPDRGTKFTFFLPQVVD
jgi:two-component system sensor histidine kinase PilS (NtrC family)